MCRWRDEGFTEFSHHTTPVLSLCIDDAGTAVDYKYLHHTQMLLLFFVSVNMFSLLVF